MRTILFTVLMLWSGISFAQTAQKDSAPDTQPTPTTSPDALKMRQPDGTQIHIVGLGSIFVPYTETIDGYTIVLANDGIYEYAKQGTGGDLVPSGIRAHDPADRDRKEISYLKKVEKHLRYQNPKLQELQEKKKIFEYTPVRKKPKNEK